jgi:L-fuculose-phosphate aldolase
MSMLSASIGGTRRLVVGLGQYGLLLGPVRRALVEPGAGFSDELLRLLICYYGRCLWDGGLIAGACGNLSARTHRDDEIFITPRAANKARLVVTEVHRISLHPAPLELARVSVEFPLHRACYEADVGVAAVIHTHAPALTAAGIRGIDVTELLPESEHALAGVRWLPYAPSGSAQLGNLVGDAVADGAHLLLLERHGAVAVGRDITEAYDRMEFGELCAKTALLATSPSPPVPPSSSGSEGA